METFTPNQESAESAIKKTFEDYLKYIPLTNEDLQKSLLDVGTGKGNFVHYVRDVLGNKNAYGVENNLARIDLSRDGVVAGSGLAIPFQDNTFEVVIAKNYLPMFVDDKEEMQLALMELLRVTKHGGKVMGDIAIPEKELEGIAEEEDVKSKAWLEKRYRGSVDFQDFLEKLKESGYSINFVDGPKSSRVVVILKP